MEAETFIEESETQVEESENTVNPVLKELAQINGQINRMSLNELHSTLNDNGLDSRGKRDVLKKRLKTYYKTKNLSTANIKDPNEVKSSFKYLIVIDYEATCDVGQSDRYKHEIIEFPAVLINTKSKKVVDEFHSFVNPQLNPVLTKFCTSLTGIKQSDVCNAPTFVHVLHSFNEWLIKHQLCTKKKNFSVVSDGPWDMGRFLVQQCKISSIRIPDWGRSWINIRKTYSNFYDTKRMCLKDMLARLGMTFEGKPHSGIDDSRNIARITLKLVQDGANMRQNERLNGTLVVNISRKEFDDMYFRTNRSSRKKNTWKKKKITCSDPPQLLEFGDQMDEAQIESDSDSDLGTDKGSLTNDPYIPLCNKFAAILKVN